MSSQLWKSFFALRQFNSLLVAEGALPPLEERPRGTHHCPTTDAKYHNYRWKCGIIRLKYRHHRGIWYCWQIREQSAGGLTYIWREQNTKPKAGAPLLQNSSARSCKKSCCCWWTGHHSLGRGFGGMLVVLNIWAGGSQTMPCVFACMRMCLCGGFRVFLCFLQRRNLSVVTKRVWSQVVSSC